MKHIFLTTILLLQLAAAAARSAPDDLQIHVVGRHADTIEAYFRQELHRETFDGVRSLRSRIIIAPASAFGTFAVVLGKKRDRFKAYGWKKDAIKPTVIEQPAADQPAAGRRVTLRWITPQILKASYGPDHSVILKFTGGDDNWHTMRSNPPPPGKPQG